MIVTRPLRETDLAPGDFRSHTLDWARFQIVEVRAAGDEDFERLYERMNEEFGHRGEMETREVLLQRLGWKITDLANGHHLSYRMLALQYDGKLAAVRDHTVIVKTEPSPRACVHLSHLVVAPEWRRTGVAGWMRAFPVQDARRTCVELGLSPKTPITLVAEMEPYENPDQLPRLKAYARAGFRRIDPTKVRYHQPDFRSFAEIDASGHILPLLFWLMVRQVGLENDDSITGLEVRRLVDAFYAMYAQGFRKQDMAPLFAELEHYPEQREHIALQEITHLLYMITAWHHPGFAADIGPHIMPMRKFDLVAQAVTARLLTPEPVTPAMLEMVHHPAYVQSIVTGQPRDLAESQKFPWTPALWPSVLLTNGAVVAAGRTALQEGVSAAVASGFHHSCYDHGEGFCTFNGLILAAEILRQEGAVKNVAVLDMDLHYGNGTATLADSRPWVRQVSLYGNDYWNNVCYRDISIRHHADGDNHRSVAISEGATWEGLETLMQESIPWLLDEVRPDLLLYQAGADYLQDDPYSPLALDHFALLARDRLVFRMAQERHIPIAWTLAGGYSEDIQKIVQVHTNTFLAAQEIYG